MSQRKRGLLIGILTGALLGALVAWVYTGALAEKQKHGQGETPSLGPSDWIRLGAAVLGVAKLLGELLSRK
jgi:hypothetical protein